jgi:putative transcriptional regulator
MTSVRSMMQMQVCGDKLMPVRWKMGELMEKKRWTNRALAKEIGKHETTVSRLKKKDIMPQIDSELLGALCRVLECKPGDLLEYVEDDDPK